MYSALLALHSFTRWFVLASLIYAIYKAYQGWFSGGSFLQSDNRVRLITTTIVHIQFTIGIILYFMSPVVGYFLNHFKDAVHQRQIRFFGMEHITMMLIAVIVITAGSSISKRKPTDKEKFKTIAIWFSIGLVIILTSIPWPFSPLVSRPYFRGF